MAVDSENRDFKFSSQFLTQQDYDFNNSLSNQTQTGSFLGLPSPVESEFGSTEIESDNNDDDDDNDDKDDDYTAKLSRRMAQYMLQDDDTNNNIHNNNNNQTIPRFGSDKLNKTWGLSGSPISTLWSPLGSSQGSPEGPSKEPSPPTTPMVAENHHAFNFSFNFFNQLDKINGPDFATVSETTPKFQKRKQQNFVKQKGSASAMQAKQAKAQVQGFSSSNAVPSLPKQANSGIKSGLPIGSGSRSGLSGTGVFLPRHINNSRRTPTPATTPQPQKKKGSSTVLIPVKVLQALQLHYERMDAESRQSVTSSPLHQEPVPDTRNGKNTMKKSYLRAAMTTTATSTKVSASTSQTDTGLPQEWTY